MKLISMREVKEMTGKSRSTIWRWIRDGKFPKPRQVGTRDIGWLESEIEEWVQALPMSPTYQEALDAMQEANGGMNHDVQDNN